MPMSWFNNLKISLKLLLGFMIVAVIAGVVGVVGVVNIRTIDVADTELYQDYTLSLEHAGSADVYFQRIRVNTLKMLSVTDENTRSGYMDRIKEFVTETDKELKDYEDGIMNEKDQALFNELKPMWEEYKSIVLSSEELLQSGKEAEARKLLLEDSQSQIDSLNDTFSKLFDYNSSSAKEKAEKMML